MPIGRYREEMRACIDRLAQDDRFTVRRLLNHVWNNPDLTRTEKQVLGKQFRREVGIPPFEDVEWIRKDEANAAHYRKRR